MAKSKPGGLGFEDSELTFLKQAERPKSDPFAPQPPREEEEATPQPVSELRSTEIVEPVVPAAASASPTPSPTPVPDVDIPAVHPIAPADFQAPSHAVLPIDLAIADQRPQLVHDPPPRREEEGQSVRRLPGRPRTGKKPLLTAGVSPDVYAFIDDMVRMGRRANGERYKTTGEYLDDVFRPIMSRMDAEKRRG
jgi:hypothetical protein